MAEKQKPGTDDLEAGMIPSNAATFAGVAIVSVAMLLAFNSRTLVEWTRQPQPGPVIAMLQAPATAWHKLMLDLGPASAFERFRTYIRSQML